MSGRRFDISKGSTVLTWERNGLVFLKIRGKTGVVDVMLSSEQAKQVAEALNTHAIEAES